MCNGAAGRYTSSYDFSMDETHHALRIVAAGTKGDPEAEAALYRAMAPRVRLYGRRHLRDEDAADDLAQQVLVLAIEKLRAGEIREPARIASFIFGTCRMLVLEMRRGDQRRDELLRQYADDLPIADIAIAPRLDEDRVARCLGKLPERERTVMVMTFHHDEPAEKVGEALGLSAGNVRVIRHRALAKLRDCVMGGAR